MIRTQPGADLLGLSHNQSEISKPLACGPSQEDMGGESGNFGARGAKVTSQIYHLGAG